MPIRRQPARIEERSSVLRETCANAIHGDPQRAMRGAETRPGAFTNRTASAAYFAASYHRPGRALVIAPAFLIRTLTLSDWHIVFVRAQRTVGGSNVGPLRWVGGRPPLRDTLRAATAVGSWYSADVLRRRPCRTSDLPVAASARDDGSWRPLASPRTCS